MGGSAHRTPGYPSADTNHDGQSDGHCDLHCHINLYSDSDRNRNGNAY